MFHFLVTKLPIKGESICDLDRVQGIVGAKFPLKLELGNKMMNFYDGVARVLKSTEYSVLFYVITFALAGDLAGWAVGFCHWIDKNFFHRRIGETPAGFSGHYAYLIDYIHPINDFAKNGKTITAGRCIQIRII